jgi:hypothetical protein
MDFVSFRPDESQSTLPGDALLSSKHTKIDSKKENYDKKTPTQQNSHKTKQKL